jgi:hypothetical protein
LSWLGGLSWLGHFVADLIGSSVPALSGARILSRRLLLGTAGLLLLCKSGTADKQSRGQYCYSSEHYWNLLGEIGLACRLKKNSLRSGWFRELK